MVDPVAVAVALFLAAYAGLRVMAHAIGQFDRWLRH
jgi:hypothetical protein